MSLGSKESRSSLPGIFTSRFGMTSSQYLKELALRASLRGFVFLERQDCKLYLRFQFSQTTHKLFRGHRFLKENQLSHSHHGWHKSIMQKGKCSQKRRPHFGIPHEQSIGA